MVTGLRGITGFPPCPTEGHSVRLHYNLPSGDGRSRSEAVLTRTERREGSVPLSPFLSLFHPHLSSREALIEYSRRHLEACSGSSGSKCCSVLACSRTFSAHLLSHRPQAWECSHFLQRPQKLRKSRCPLWNEVGSQSLIFSEELSRLSEEP